MRYHTEKYHFFQDKHPDSNIQDITNIIKEHWDNLSKSEQNKYIIEYQNELKDFRELQGLIEEINSRPKKPMTPYLLFFKEQLNFYR